MQAVSSPSSCVLQYVNSSTDILCWYRYRYWKTLWYGSLSRSFSSIVCTISSVVRAKNQTGTVEQAATAKHSFLGVVALTLSTQTFTRREASCRWQQADEINGIVAWL